MDREGGRKEAVGGGGNPPRGSVEVPGAPAAIIDVDKPGGGGGGLYALGVCGSPGAPGAPA